MWKSIKCVPIFILLHFTTEILCSISLSYNEPSSSVSKFNIRNNVQFEDLSLCFWVKLNNLNSMKIIDFEFRDKKGLGFTIQQEYGFLNLKNTDLLFDYNFHHVPQQWRHFCVLYSSKLQNIQIYADGQLTFEKENFTVLEGHDFHENLLSHVTIGSSRSQHFHGEFSKMYFWTRVIDEEVRKQSLNCNPVSRDNLVLDWDEVEIIRGEGIEIIDLKENCPSKLNENKFSMVGFGKRVLFGDYLNLCYGLGGSEFVPETEEDLLKIRESFQEFENNCSNKFWVPIRQSNGRWISSENKQVNYLPWSPGQPNGGTHQDCVEAKFDSHANHARYNDLNCALSHRCFYCNLKSPQRFTLRGLCAESKVDTHFIGQFQQERPKFLGFRNYEISFEDDTWLLIHVATRDVVARFNGSKLWPTGEHEWMIEDDVCGDSHYRTLLFSSCEDEQFTCSDGTCIPLSYQCNGVSDCMDQSDERECNVIQYPESRNYESSLPPILRTDDGKISPVMVNVSVNLLNIADIKETKLQWTVKMELELLWTDARLEWKHLRQDNNLNIIPSLQITQQSIAEQFKPPVWVPVILFLNTPHTDISSLDAQSSLTVVRRGEYKLSELENVKQVTFYNGAENPLNYQRKYTKTFACDIQLHHYPFDVQECSIRLGLQTQLQSLVLLQSQKLLFTGSKEMMQFQVSKWNIKDTPYGVEVTVTLQRLYQHHLYNTFIPTLCLMIIAQTTLYFNKEHFKTNVPVTITTMLVMYTLYMAVSNKLPPTSYIKMIDIWLIFGLTLPFTVFFFHVLIEHLPSRHQNQETEMFYKRVRDSLSIIGKFVLPCIIVSFVIIYFSFAILVYNNIL